LTNAPANSTGTTGERYYGRLHRTLAAGRFAVTAEIVPPRGASLSGVKRRARIIKDWIDAANITDGQSAVVRAASWACSIGLMQEGVEPVMQLQCRDRNRIALQADLLGAAAVGIPNVLLLTGDHTRFGDHPDAKPVVGAALAHRRGREPICSAAAVPRRAAGQEDRGGGSVRANPVRF
jgi:5,10-methylenetetrahydrofolate reductase